MLKNRTTELKRWKCKRHYKCQTQNQNMSSRIFQIGFQCNCRDLGGFSVVPIYFLAVDRPRSEEIVQDSTNEYGSHAKEDGDTPLAISLPGSYI